VAWLAKYVLPVVTGNTRQKCEACDLLKSGEAVGCKGYAGKVHACCSTSMRYGHHGFGTVSVLHPARRQCGSRTAVSRCHHGQKWVRPRRWGRGERVELGHPVFCSSLNNGKPRSYPRDLENQRTGECKPEATGASRARPLPQPQITETSRRRASHRARKGLVCCCPTA